jgi:hypothetical protein
VRGAEDQVLADLNQHDRFPQRGLHHWGVEALKLRERVAGLGELALENDHEPWELQEDVRLADP